ncbi:hypothetical protein BV917_17615 [Leptospira santarosai serovar Guaricura]|nr:hypothetical protein BV917_17615 [Leptospira santarosai serovar Guaricura]
MYKISCGIQSADTSLFNRPNAFLQRVKLFDDKYAKKDLLLLQLEPPYQNLSQKATRSRFFMVAIGQNIKRDP